MRKDVYVLSGAERRNGYVSGCFYELARTVIEDGGIAVGAAYSEDFSVRHVEINSAEQLKRITGVKYPESHIGKEIRERIKSYLESGRKVIFAGTPCQVESIYQDLHEKYDNLLTISVGCSGVIDPKVWKDYVTETQSYGSVISEIYCPYRGMFGISQRKILIRFSHGTAYFRDRKEDILLRLRDAGLIFKKECYQCPWTQGYDKADISLEIYRESVEKETVREEGLTKASVYTAKGKKLLLSSKSRLCIYNCSVNNGKIQTQKPVMPSNYNYFWNYYNNYDYLFAANLMASESDSSLQNKVMLDFLKKCMILDARGISLKKVLENWGLESVVLYGDGDVDKIIEDKLRREQIIVRSFEHITESNQPVLVSPTCFIPDVIARMKEAGTDKKRLLPLQLLISQEYDYHILNGANHTVWNRDSNGIGDIYLITGAQFGNKGAQSMLFVAVSELRRKYPDCDIYYLPIDTMENYPDSIVRRYRFHILRDGMHIYSQLYDLLPQLKGIVDISGYGLSSKWNCSYFVWNLLLGANQNIPVYLMPQSFGPFEFEEEQNKRIQKGLSHATVIFAREKAGYDLLIRKYGLKNVRLSRDLVLQNRGLVTENIYREELRKDDYRLKTSGNVAVIPNSRNYEFGNKAAILELYRHIIDEILRKNKNVYIVSHSADERACEDIYEMFSGSGHVFLYKNVFSEKKLDCLEFSILAREFQYMIASRYHAIVHAYKEGIPCVAIGWAEKYGELLDLFDQGEYGFDVRHSNEIDRVVNAVKQMDNTWTQEQKKIREKLSELQTENCFDVVK